MRCFERNKGVCFQIKNDHEAFAAASRNTVLAITNKYAFAAEKYLGCIPPPIELSKGKILFRVKGEELII